MHSIMPATPPKAPRPSANGGKFGPYRGIGARELVKPKLQRSDLMDRIQKKLTRCRTSSLERFCEDIPSQESCGESLALDVPHNSACTPEHIETVFNYFDKDNSGTIRKCEIEEVVRQLGLDVTPDTFSEILDEFPLEALTFAMFSECIKKLDVPVVNAAAEGLMHMNKTIMRAKKLAMEMANKEPLDKQLTNLFHMQNHYRMITKARASVDSWHYSQTSKCYHAHAHGLSPRLRKNKKCLPMDRMQMILSYADEDETCGALPPDAGATKVPRCDAPTDADDSSSSQSSCDAPSEAPIRRASMVRRGSVGIPAVSGDKSFLAKQSEKVGMCDIRVSHRRRSSLLESHKVVDADDGRDWKPNCNVPQRRMSMI